MNKFKITVLFTVMHYSQEQWDLARIFVVQWLFFLSYHFAAKELEVWYDSMKFIYWSWDFYSRWHVGLSNIKHNK
jgi:hypothetical protein